jgi:hypothetical protein
MSRMFHARSAAAAAATAYELREARLPKWRRHATSGEPGATGEHSVWVLLDVVYRALKEGGYFPFPDGAWREEDDASDDATEDDVTSVEASSESKYFQGMAEALESKEVLRSVTAEVARALPSGLAPESASAMRTFVESVLHSVASYVNETLYEEGKYDDSNEQAEEQTRDWVEGAVREYLMRSIVDEDEDVHADAAKLYAALAKRAPSRSPRAGSPKRSRKVSPRASPRAART